MAVIIKKTEERIEKNATIVVQDKTHGSIIVDVTQTGFNILNNQRLGPDLPATRFVGGDTKTAYLRLNTEEGVVTLIPIKTRS